MRKDPNLVTRKNRRVLGGFTLLTPDHLHDGASWNPADMQTGNAMGPRCVEVRDFESSNECGGILSVLPSTLLLIHSICLRATEERCPIPRRTQLCFRMQKL